MSKRNPQTTVKITARMLDRLAPCSEGAEWASAFLPAVISTDPEDNIELACAIACSRPEYEATTIRAARYTWLDWLRDRSLHGLARRDRVAGTIYLDIPDVDAIKWHHHIGQHMPDELRLRAQRDPFIIAELRLRAQRDPFIIAQWLAWIADGFAEQRGR